MKQLRLTYVSVSAVLAMTAMAWNAEAGTPVETAIQIGLTPEALVAADVSIQEADGMLVRLAAAASARSEMDATLRRIDECVVIVTAATQRVLDSPADESARQALESAARDLAAARSTFQLACANMSDLAIRDVDSGAVAMPHAFHATHGRDVPAEFRIQERSDIMWDLLERASRAEERAERRSDEVDEDLAQILASVRNEPEVRAAAQRLANDLRAMQELFEGR